MLVPQLVTTGITFHSLRFRLSPPDGSTIPRDRLNLESPNPIVEHLRLRLEG